MKIKKQKKIILFYKKISAWGGAENFLFNQLVCLNNMGYKVNIVCFFSEKNFLDNHFSSHINQIIIFNSNYLISFFKLIIFLLKNRPDWIFCSSGHMEVYIVSKLLCLKYWLHVHHPSFMCDDDFDIYRFRNNKIFNKLSKKFRSGKRIIATRKKLKIYKLIFYRIRSIISINSLKNASGIFVHSHYHKYEKYLLYGLRSYVLNGAFKEECLSQIRKKEINSKGEINLLSLSRLDPNKRIDLLIKSTKYLNQYNEKYIINIIGTGPDYQRLLKIKKQMNSDNIKFLGFIKDIKLNKFFMQTTIFLALDIGDFKLNMHEALLNHIPCIVSEETQIDSLLSKSGYVIKTNGTPKDLAFKIQELSFLIKNNKKHFKKIILEEYLSKITWEEYHKKMIKLVKKGK